MAPTDLLSIYTRWWCHCVTATTVVLSGPHGSRQNGPKAPCLMHAPRTLGVTLQ